MTYPYPFEPLEIALATVADAVVATDAQEKIIYLNPAAEAMTGWRAVDALSQPLAQVLAMGDHRTGLSTESPLQRITEHNQSAAIAVPAVYVDRDGRRARIEYTAVAMRDESGSLSGVVVVCRRRDPAPETPRPTGIDRLPVRAVEPGAVAHREEADGETLGDAMIGTDFSGRVNYISAVSERITGWTQSDARGVAVDEVCRLLDAATRHPVPCPTARAIIENRRVTPGVNCLLCRRDGSEVAVEISAAPMHDRNGGVIGAMMVAHCARLAHKQPDATGRESARAESAKMPSRSMFGDRLARAIADARAKGRYAALLYVGIDRLKYLRESLGRAAGESLLEAIARRLVGCVRTTDTVGRQGDDVFVVLLTDLLRVNDASACAEKILVALQSPYRIANDALRVSVNVGIAIFPIDANEGEELLRCADFAMYQARYDGRNNYRLFSPRSPGDPSA